MTNLIKPIRLPRETASISVNSHSHLRIYINAGAVRDYGFVSGIHVDPNAFFDKAAGKRYLILSPYEKNSRNKGKPGVVVVRQYKNSENLFIQVSKYSGDLESKGNEKVDAWILMNGDIKLSLPHHFKRKKGPFLTPEPIHETNGSDLPIPEKEGFDEAAVVEAADWILDHFNKAEQRMISRLMLGRNKTGKKEGM